MHEETDIQETQEWLDALQAVIRHSGKERAAFLIKQLSDRATNTGVQLPAAITTPYRNTIPSEAEKRMPGDLFMERRIRSLIRWNALAMVVRANSNSDSLGGHIASFSSAATLYDVAFNYFFRGNEGEERGDLIFFQGHSAPGIYARSYLEGRFDEEQLDNFRREVNGNGLSSYPHPWLMPEYWQFPTVSMGLGPIQAIYQAHIMRYLSARGLSPRGDRKVWAFLGDGECDEPESLGAIALAGREKLENLVFVVNCNLQRLDGPVRGNGKIVQELEGVFRGAGWNVIKVLWGRLWDPLFEKDDKGLLQKVMDETVDGEMQNFKANGGAYTREHFFGKYPELKEMVKDFSDEEIMKLNRGGHDPYKVYAAYAEAMASKGKPTVILAQTVKGYGLGAAGEAAMDTHNVKKMDTEALKRFRDRFAIPITDKEIEEVPYYRPSPDSPEMKYMDERRKALGGPVPSRSTEVAKLEIPELDAFSALTKGSGDREISTTMAFVRALSVLVKDKKMGQNVAPIVPDEARTFGMEGLFRQLGIYSSQGQKYTPVDHGQIMYYKEDKKGQVLEEGINEAGAMSAWMALATAYSNHGVPMVPFYIYYSMFGFQRIGDLAWAAGDMQARGFLVGATAGRTTLNGEGLQHQDGHSHVLSATIPNCKSYDPAYGYDLAVIMRQGLKEMYEEQQNLFYYITIENENYLQPEMPQGVEEGIIRGIYKLDNNSRKVGKGKAAKKHVQLVGAGSILREVLAAADILADQFGVTSDVWNLTSATEASREAQDVARWNMLHPTEEARKSWIGEQFEGNETPVIISTDYIRSYVEPLREFIDGDVIALGTDGFGRSDSREQLRRFFEVNRNYVVIAALTGLANQGVIEAKVVADAIKKLNIDPEKVNPRLV
ncbi:pyruvate dehydrogenase (acetyl-transferring), homodimeric type [Microbulbifer agarilyticus]|uniref:Pyruvate dehydrogenase E1 component n=1 Tax=Microbulbifer agarilyticus TaxID=260552 RepID=A0A1Q2M764_9GAMM|nr:pyruvate dehydrogenase (acetyl-transferring), homodimeric type [Microbulbifer agarilyticus]AQQ68585.1 pyruvate dehydrogenase (acetyl-transferring), homodimeric type [Microbulbifer agarilyticus]